MPRIRKSNFITLKGFDVRGARPSGIVLRSGVLSNADVTLKGNDIHDNVGGTSSSITIGHE